MLIKIQPITLFLFEIVVICIARKTKITGQKLDSVFYRHRLFTELTIYNF